MCDLKNTICTVVVDMCLNDDSSSAYTVHSMTANKTDVKEELFVTFPHYFV